MDRFFFFVPNLNGGNETEEQVYWKVCPHVKGDHGESIDVYK